MYIPQSTVCIFHSPQYVYSTVHSVYMQPWRCRLLLHIDSNVWISRCWSAECGRQHGSNPGVRTGTSWTHCSTYAIINNRARRALSIINMIHIDVWSACFNCLIYRSLLSQPLLPKQCWLPLNNWQTNQSCLFTLRTQRSRTQSELRLQPPHFATIAIHGWGN